MAMACAMSLRKETALSTLIVTYKINCFLQKFGNGHIPHGLFSCQGTSHSFSNINYYSFYIYSLPIYLYLLILYLFLFCMSL